MGEMQCCTNGYKQISIESRYKRKKVVQMSTYRVQWYTFEKKKFKIVFQVHTGAIYLTDFLCDAFSCLFGGGCQV